MDLDLKGKHFIITGGTRGIGRAIALAFADEGADVSICARDARGCCGNLAGVAGQGHQGRWPGA